MAELRIDPEEGVISALMVEPKAVEKICNMLSPEMFTSAVLGRIYLEYLRAYDRNTELTLAELQIVLGDEMMPYEVEDALSRCLDSRLTSADIVGSAKAILARYKKSCVDKILERVTINEGNVDGQIESLISDLETVHSGSEVEGRTVAEITRQYSEEYFNDNKKPLVLLGEDKIDNLTGGFQGGDLVVIAARPAAGKSALASQWAWTFAQQGLKVGYFNCEMQERSVFERYVASKTGIEIARIRFATRFCNDEEIKYRGAIKELSGQENITIYTGAKKVSEIRQETRKRGFKVILVDYLQLLIPDSRYQGNRTAEVGEISRALKELAMSLDVVVIALSQLNRASEGRASKQPLMSDIRESGSIEQDASVIFLLWNRSDENRTEKGFSVEKSRNGQTGRADLIFNGARLHFTLEDNATPFDEV